MQISNNHYIALVRVSLIECLTQLIQYLVRNSNNM